MRLSSKFPVGTTVTVEKDSLNGRGQVIYSSTTVGVVLEWMTEPTGAPYASSGDPSIQNANGHLLLDRLKLRLPDGEITDIVLDDLTTISSFAARNTI